MLGTIELDFAVQDNRRLDTCKSVKKLWALAQLEPEVFELLDHGTCTQSLGISLDITTMTVQVQ